MNKSYTLSAEDQETYQRLLKHLQQGQKPLYVVVMNEQPESYLVPAHKSTGFNAGKTKAVFFSDAVEVDSVVSVRSKR